MTSLSPHDLLWCTRRLPRPVRDLLKKHGASVFIAGGFVRSCVTNEPINDIDVFAPTADTAKALAAELAGEGGKTWASDNAITVKGTRPTVQFIHRWTFAAPADALASFDFTIASAAIWWDGERWQSLCHADFYADLAARRLVYLSPSRNEDAGGSMLRVLKFYQRGYRIPLDSLGAVIARLGMGVEQVKRGIDEAHLARVVTGLLREVDPLLDPDHIAHLPAMNATADPGGDAVSEDGW